MAPPVAVPAIPEQAPRGVAFTAQRVARLQAGVGNQAVLRLRHSAGAGVAESVAARGSSAVPTRPVAGANGSQALQRKCADCDEKDARLRRKPDGGVDGGDVPPLVADVLGSPGHPLDAETRDNFAQRFGRDFDDVTVHTDARAAESARAVGAQAYTVGRHMVFGTGQFDARSERGRLLLAHELTHVVQQGAARRPSAVVRRQVVHPSAASPPAGAAGDVARIADLAARAQAVLAHAGRGGDGLRARQPRLRQLAQRSFALLAKGLPRAPAGGAQPALSSTGRRRLRLAERLLGAHVGTRGASFAAPAEPIGVTEQRSPQLAAKSLHLGARTDPSEAEADRVAKRIVRGEPAAIGSSAMGVVQRRGFEMLRGPTPSPELAGEAEPLVELERLAPKLLEGPATEPELVELGEAAEGAELAGEAELVGGAIGLGLLEILAIVLIVVVVVVVIILVIDALTSEPELQPLPGPQPPQPRPEPEPEPEPHPQPLPQPLPQPRPRDPDDDRRRCPPNTLPILWPFPSWTLPTIGIGDSGSVNPANNRPPRIIARSARRRRDESIVHRYRHNNAAAIIAANARGIKGEIHHKWPLYLSGPDLYDNLVFFQTRPFNIHNIWHQLLAHQPHGYLPNDAPYTMYCVL